MREELDLLLASFRRWRHDQATLLESDGAGDGGWVHDLNLGILRLVEAIADE